MKTTAGVTIAGGAPAPNQPPVVLSTPLLVFTEGTASSYSMAPHFSDPDGDVLTYELTIILPNGLSFDNATGILTYDGIGSASVSQHTTKASDGEFEVETSSFDINIQSGDVWPKLATPRTGTPNWGQAGALAAADRAVIGLMDACSLSGFGTSFMDTTPPATNWIARTQVTQEVIAANPDNSIYVFYYENQMETGATGSIKAD